MKRLDTNDIRSGRLACSLILITSILLIRYCHCYIRSYAMPLEAAEAQMLEEVNEVQMSEKTNDEAQKAVEEIVEEVEKITYDIPSSFVHPVTGKTVSYKGGKTIERTGKITYGDAGDINRMASPDQDGFMKLDNRYLIAVGSRFDTVPGQYMDLVLENGVVIPCIMGDLKADQDTDSTNTFTYHSRCCSEFIIDEDSIRTDIYERGNASLKTSRWDSPVMSVIVYDKIY